MGNPQFSVTMKLILALMMLCGAVISASVKSQVKAHVKGEAAAAKKQFKSLMARANKYVISKVKGVEKRINAGAAKLIAKQILVQKATTMNPTGSCGSKSYLCRAKMFQAPWEKLAKEEVDKYAAMYKANALKYLPSFLKTYESAALKKLAAAGKKLGGVSKKVKKNMKKVEKIYKSAFKDQLKFRLKDVKPALVRIEKKARSFLAQGIKIANALAKDAGAQKKIDFKKVYGAKAKKFAASITKTGIEYTNHWTKHFTWAHGKLIDHLAWHTVKNFA